MSKTLYDEAIADAKRLREVAETNAKNAIVEAVTPRIREFIDKQLVSENVKSVSADDFLVSALNEEESHNEDDDVVLDETAIKSLVSLFTPKKQKDINDPVQAAFDQLSESEKKALKDMLNTEEAGVGGSHQENNMDEMMYELDLNDLKKEIAAVNSPVKASPKAAAPRPGVRGKPKMEEMYEEEDDAGIIGGVPLDEDDYVDEDYMSLDESVLEIDLGDLELPEDFMPTVRIVPEEDEDEVAMDDEDMDSAPVDDAEGESMGDEEQPPAPVAETFYVDENMLRHELFRLREARKQREDKLLNKKSLRSASHVKAAAKAFGDGTLEEVDEVEMNALDNAKKHKLKKLKEARDNRALVTQLNEYRSAVETLREQMTDMNLFNAKLLYVNKMLQSKDLTPKQQKVVIEAIDGAKTLREVKMLFKSLTESLTGGNGATLNESATRFNAGGSSRATSSAAARTGETAEVDRWAMLAGLK